MTTPGSVFTDTDYVLIATNSLTENQKNAWTKWALIVFEIDIKLTQSRSYLFCSFGRIKFN